MQNLSYHNECDFHESELVGRTHFQMNGFARRLVLTQMQFKSQLENGPFFWQVERDAKNLYKLKEVSHVGEWKGKHATITTKERKIGH